MSSSTPNTYDQEKEHSGFRLGQSYSTENVKDKLERDPYLQFLIVDLPEEALGAGFDFVDPVNDEPLKNNAQIRADFDPYLPLLIKGEEIERAHGYCVNILRESDNPEKKKAPFLRLFAPEDVILESTKYYNDLSIEQIGLREWQPSGSSNEITIPDGDKGTELKNLFYDIKRTKNQPYEERPLSEVFWDLIVGLEYIRMGATVFAIRVGAGMRFAMMPPDATKEQVDEVRTGVRQWDSFNGVFVLPKGAEIAIESSSGMVDYDKLKNVLLEAFSTKSKVPMARLKGIEPGQLSGADVNERSLIDVYRKNQRAIKAKVHWLVMRLNEHYSWGLNDDDWKPLWTVREQLNDTDKAALDDKIAETTIKLYSNELLTFKEARERIGEDPNIDPIEPRHIAFGEQEEEQVEETTEEETEETDNEHETGSTGERNPGKTSA